MSPLTLKFEKHIDITLPEKPAIDWLAEHSPELTRQKLKQAMQLGAVWLTRKNQTSRLRRAKKILEFGDELHLYFDHNILFQPVKPARLIADEGAYSVWHKPCGMFSQGTKWGDHSAICRWVELNGLPDRQAFLVHRLDRATNGLILVAHQKKVATQLAALFEQRQIEKHYRALVGGRYPVEPSYLQLDSEIDGKSAVTRILENQYLAERDQTCLLLTIETGRKHQIRKHLAGKGFPIIGDRQYGQEKSDSDLQLQSCYLAFRCPLSGEAKCYSIAANPDHDFSN